MAYNNTISVNTDPIISMVRSVNVLLSQKPAEEIRKALNDHAFPRIRMRILSATAAEVNGEGTGTNQGVSIWFETLKDMADPVVQASVEADIDMFIQGNALLKDGIYSIAARLAASLLTAGLAAQVLPQANYAMELEKVAMGDLEKLIRTPFFASSVEAVKESKLTASKIPRIFIASAINDDETTYSALTNLGAVYTGAVVGGLAQLYIGHAVTDVVTFAFPAGTTPAQILSGLSAAWRTQQQAHQILNTPYINVVLAPDEGRPITGSRVTNYKNYPALTATATRSPAVYTTLGFLQITPYQYDKIVDFLNVEMVLRHESVPGSGIYDSPGVPGILYGIEPIYSALTEYGPHSVLIDLATGLATSVNPTADTKAETRISDTFYFGVSAPAEGARATATIAGTVTPGDSFTVTVNGTAYTHTAPASPTPTTVATALAALVDAGLAYNGSSALGVLTVASLTATAVDNGVPFAVATDSLTATFTSGFTILDLGRNANTLTTSGSLIYRFGEMVDPLNVVPTSISRTRTIACTRGEPVLDVIKRLADDMAQFSKTSRCLGALRAPTVFKIMGTPFNAPGLTIVPYVRDVDHYAVVFDILTVPDGLLFAPMPYELIPVPADLYFDSNAKSLIVQAKFIPGSGAAGSSATQALTATDRGEIKVSQPIHSRRISSAFADIHRMLNS